MTVRIADNTTSTNLLARFGAKNASIQDMLLLKKDAKTFQTKINTAEHKKAYVDYGKTAEWTAMVTTLEGYIKLAQ